MDNNKMKTEIKQLKQQIEDAEKRLFDSFQGTDTQNYVIDEYKDLVSTPEGVHEYLQDQDLNDESEILFEQAGFISGLEWALDMLERLDM